MKAITLWQPWATWIALGWKTIETRGHANFRCLVGQTIAIHAGKQFDRWAFGTAAPYMSAAQRDEFSRTVFPSGMIVGTAHVWLGEWLKPENAKAALCPTDTSRYGLFLDDTSKASPPIQCKGAQGIWEVPAPVELLIEAFSKSSGLALR